MPSDFVWYSVWNTTSIQPASSANRFAGNVAHLELRQEGDVLRGVLPDGFQNRGLRCLLEPKYYCRMPFY